MGTPRKKASITRAAESKPPRSVVLRDGRRIYAPTDPSVIGWEKIREAVDRVVSKRK
jgi:hypothetical protein